MAEQAPDMEDEQIADVEDDDVTGAEGDEEEFEDEDEEDDGDEVEEDRPPVIAEVCGAGACPHPHFEIERRSAPRAERRPSHRSPTFLMRPGTVLIVNASRSRSSSTSFHESGADTPA